MDELTERACHASELARAERWAERDEGCFLAREWRP